MIKINKIRTSLWLVIFSTILVSICLGFTYNNYLGFTLCLSFINVAIISSFLSIKLFRKPIILIFFSYQAIILIIPIVYVVLFYSQSDLDIYFGYRMISTEDLFHSSLITFVFHFFLCISIVFWNRCNIKVNISRALNYSVIKGSKIFLIIILLLIAYSMKLYLIDIGAWFMAEIVDLTQYPLANLAMLLEKLDLLVLFYFTYLFKSGKLNLIHKSMIILIIFTSIPFAIISTSKEKVLMLLIPLAMMVFHLKSRIIKVAFLACSVLVLSSFFDYMKVLRYSDDIFSASVEYLDLDSEQKSKPILSDSVLIRLDYQSILALAVQKTSLFPDDYNFEYVNNIVGIVPRAIWPGKPQITTNTNEIGRKLGILNSSDYVTSIGLTPVGHAYYNLGVFGIPFIAVLVSFFLVLVTNSLTQNSWPNYLLTFMFAIMLARNGAYVNILPALIQSLIIYYLASILLAERKPNN